MMRSSADGGMKVSEVTSEVGEEIPDHPQEEDPQTKRSLEVTETKSRIWRM